VKLNVMALVDSAGFDAEGLAKGVELADYGLKPGDLTELKRLFEHATTFGSLIQVPEGLAEKLPALKQLSEATSQDMFVAEALKRLGPLVRQAKLLAAQYDAVVANPPYMGSKGMNSVVKTFTQDHFPDAKQRSLRVLHRAQLPTSEELWSERNGNDAELDVLVVIPSDARANAPAEDNHDDGTDWIQQFSIDELEDCSGNSVLFSKLPGSPIAYWASNRVRSIYDESKPLQSFADIGKGLDTGDNESFLRLWFEPGRGPRWVPCLKGGPYRKWYGNHDYVIDWLDDGRVLRDSPGSNLRNAHNYLRPGLTWTRVSSSLPAFRSFGDGFIFESTGPCIFTKSLSQTQLAAFLNSKLTPAFLRLVAPTLDFHISGFWVVPKHYERSWDWDAYERSWDFQSFPILTASSDPHPHSRIQLHRLDNPEPRHHRRDEAPRRGKQPPLHRRLRPGRRTHPRRPLSRRSP
jgi:hypothetical protein